MNSRGRPQPKKIRAVAPPITGVIRIIRGERVMLDALLANLYGIETKALNRAIKRNAGKLPAAFMFRLTSLERII